MEAITKINSNIKLEQEIRILMNNKEVLDAAEEIIADQLAVLNRFSKFCHKPAEIGRRFGMSGAGMRMRDTPTTSTVASTTSTVAGGWCRTWCGRRLVGSSCSTSSMGEFEESKDGDGIESVSHSREEVVRLVRT